MNCTGQRPGAQKFSGQSGPASYSGVRTESPGSKPSSPDTQRSASFDPPTHETKRRFSICTYGVSWPGANPQNPETPEGTTPRAAALQPTVVRILVRAHARVRAACVIGVRTLWSFGH